MTNLLIALAGLFILGLALAPIIGAWLRSRQPQQPETCGQCRWLEQHFDGWLCGRRALRKMRTSQACDIGEVRE
ncbi:MAG: hypothetical protein WBR35_24365 [Anaerolineae bacterium]